MGEAENLANAAQALTTAAQQYASAAGECTTVTGNAVALGQELQTTWQGKASAAFMDSLDKLSGDSFNLMNAFNEASAIMNGLALAIQANLGPVSTGEQYQQQYGSNLSQLPPSFQQQYNEVQSAASTALTTITYLANSAAGSLEAVNSVGVCSTGLGVMNMASETKTVNGKTSFIVNGKTLLVVDDATDAILENNTGGGSGGNPPTPPTGGGGGGHWWESEGWWHDWWGKDAPWWQRMLIRLPVGFAVSTVTSASSTLIQHKPWSWDAWALQGGLLSASYEASVLGGIKGPVDKIFSALFSAIIIQNTVSAVQPHSHTPNPSPGPAPVVPAPTTTAPSTTKSSSSPAPATTPTPTTTPTPSLTPMPSTPPTYAPIH